MVKVSARIAGAVLAISGVLSLVIADKLVSVRDHQLSLDKAEVDLGPITGPVSFEVGYWNLNRFPIQVLPNVQCSCSATSWVGTTVQPFQRGRTLVNFDPTKYPAGPHALDIQLTLGPVGAERAEHVLLSFTRGTAK